MTIVTILSKNIRRLIRLGSFLECWRSDNVTAIAKGAPSLDRENYRAISITPILSKVYEKLDSHKLSSFCEKYGLFPAAQYASKKGLGCTDALFTISHVLLNSLDEGMESCIVQLDFICACYCFPCLSYRIGISRLVKRILVDTSVLLRCYFAFVLPILEYCSPVSGSAAEISSLSARCIRWPGLIPNRVSCRAIDVMFLGWAFSIRLIRTLITLCSAGFHLLLPEFDNSELRSQLIHWSLKYQGVERPNLLGLSCRLRFECGMTFPAHTVFDTRTMDEFKVPVNRWLLRGVVFSSVFLGAGVCGVEKAI